MKGNPKSEGQRPKEDLEEWYDLLRQKAGSLAQTGNSASAAFLEFELSGLKTIVRKIGALRAEKLRQLAEKAGYPMEGGRP